VVAPGAVAEICPQLTCLESLNSIVHWAAVSVASSHGIRIFIHLEVVSTVLIQLKGVWEWLDATEIAVW
jgi:hypothetical protein